MSKPEVPHHGVVFDLSAVATELRELEGYHRDGHIARTLVREEDLRVVLIVATAGARITEHQAKDTVSIHTVHGNVRLTLSGDDGVDLSAGQVLVLEGALPHDVEALTESTLLLTLGGRRKSRP